MIRRDACSMYVMVLARRITCRVCKSSYYYGVLICWNQEGGLIYTTCTYNPAENEAVVQELLEQRPATLQPITLPVPHSPGLLQWKEYTYDARMQHCWRLYPHQTGSVGFFVASIRA